MTNALYNESADVVLLEPAQPSDQNVLAGIYNLFDSYIELTARDQVIICYWHECDSYVAWLLYALRTKRMDWQLLPFANRDQGQFVKTLNILLETASQQNQHGKIVVIVCEQEALSFSTYLKQLHQKSNIHVCRMMNTSEHLFNQALLVPTQELKNINANLLEKLRAHDQITLNITQKNGTDLHITLDNTQYQWISAYGVSTKKELLLLPSGEINTYPRSISGTFVASGAMHANIKLPFDTRLAHKPVTFNIQNGIVQTFQCDDVVLHNFLQALLQEPHMNAVGEMGIGTNIGITQFVKENSHINERFPGVHLGFGAHFQKQKICYQPKFHVDFINPFGMIHVINTDEKINLENLQEFRQKFVPHPMNTSAEDGD